MTETKIHLFLPFPKPAVCKNFGIKVVFPIDGSPNTIVQELDLRRLEGGGLIIRLTYDRLSRESGPSSSQLV